MTGYGQFCPIAKAAEILTERWTPLVLRELMCGSTRFSELHRGVPLMSTALVGSIGFAVDWMRKDLGLVLEESEHNGASLQLTKLVDEFYADVQAMGGKRWDTSSLIARLERPGRS